MRTYIHTYIHTDIHTYIRTYVRTYIFIRRYCTYVRSEVAILESAFTAYELSVICNQTTEQLKGAADHHHFSECALTFWIRVRPTCNPPNRPTNRHDNYCPNRTGLMKDRN